MEAYIKPIGGASRMLDQSISSQVLDNIYIADMPEGAVVERVILPFVGYAIYRVLDTLEENKVIRGIHYSSTGINGLQTAYIATYSKVYRVTANSDLQNGLFFCGDISSGYNKVRFTDNGFDLFIVDGTLAYTCSLSASDLTVSTTWNIVNLPEINANKIKPSNCIFSKQRIVIDSGENQFFYSDLASTTFDQLSFYSAEVSADKIRAMDMVGDTILILGDTSSEGWTFEGSPMQKIDGSISDIGIMAKDSLAVIGGSALWLASSKSGRFTIMRSNGVGTPVRVSDMSIEQEISRLEQPESGIGLTFYDLGQQFYIINFIHDRKTFCLNLTSGKWNTLSNTEANTAKRLAWQPNVIVSAYNGKLLAGSGNSTDLLEISANYFSYGSEPIVRTWETPILWEDLNLMQIKSITLDITTGSTTNQADVINDNVDPKIFFRYSKDSGRSFQDQEYLTLGKIGEYEKELPTWLNIGVMPRFVAQFILSASIRFSIKGLKIKYNKVARL